MTTTEEWILQPDRCPADVDFVKMLQTMESGKHILHMGPGLHHIVGKAWSGLGFTNFVTAVTCSPPEVSAYMQWAIENPKQSRGYQCLFADLYNLDTEFLGKYDIITLFHLCERPDLAEQRKEYTDSGPEALVLKLLGRLKEHGLVMSYRGSAASEEAEALLHKYIEEAHIWNFESLRVWEPSSWKR